MSDEKTVIDKPVYISTTDARDIAHEMGIKITLPTLIVWVKENKLGHQPGSKSGGHWLVDKKKWEDFLIGN